MGDNKVTPSPVSDTTLKLPLDCVRQCPVHPRRQSANDLQPLVMSLVQHGQLEPIHVRALSRSEFEVVDGQSRLQALNLIRSMPVLLECDTSPLELGVVQAVVCQHTEASAARWRYVNTEGARPLSSFEQAHALVAWWAAASLEQNRHLTSREFAAISHRSHTYVAEAQLIVSTLTDDEFIDAGFIRSDGVNWWAVRRLGKTALRNAARRRGEQRRRTLRNGLLQDWEPGIEAPENRALIESCERDLAFNAECATELDALLRDDDSSDSPGEVEVRAGDDGESAGCTEPVDAGTGGGAYQRRRLREPTLAMTPAAADAIRADVYAAAERGDGVRIRFVTRQQALSAVRARAISAKAEAVVLAMVQRFLDPGARFFLARHAAGIIAVVPIVQDLNKAEIATITQEVTHSMSGMLRHAATDS